MQVYCGVCNYLHEENKRQISLEKENQRLQLKIESLLSTVEHLTNEKEHLLDITYELEQNLLAAEDQNHYLVMFKNIRDQLTKAEKALNEYAGTDVGTAANLYFKDKYGK